MRFFPIFKSFSLIVFKLVVLGIGLVVIVNLFIILISKKYIYSDSKDIPKVETILILGAGVSADGALSPILKERADKGLEIYESGRGKKFLISGDNSSVYHNEVNPVQDYLVGKGVPSADIYLDHAGFDTYSTMYRAREIFKASPMLIVTQSFHLPRAVFLARSLKLEAYGLPATDEAGGLKNYFREIFAREKAVIDLVSRRQPKFLGEKIPIQ